jgi:hypothetical protein
MMDEMSKVAWVMWEWIREMLRGTTPDLRSQVVTFSVSCGSTEGQGMTMCIDTHRRGVVRAMFLQALHILHKRRGTSFALSTGFLVEGSVARKISARISSGSRRTSETKARWLLMKSSSSSLLARRD